MDMTSLSGSAGWIMVPFNALFWAVFAVFLLILVAVSLVMRRRSDRAKRKLITASCVLMMVSFVAYKYCLSIDPDFDRLTAAMGGFNWWGELPLHLCNINMLLMPVAVWSRKRSLLSFCFFLGPLGALMALAMPSAGFSGFPLYLPRMLGYYGIHFMIVITALAIVTFGLYRPRFRDLPVTALTVLLVALAVFGINMLLRSTGLHPKANYFYSVETEGNFLLELFHSWLPWPFLYLLPCILILGVYMAAITLGFHLTERRGKDKKK